MHVSTGVLSLLFEFRYRFVSLGFHNSSSGIAFQRHRGHRDDRTCGEPLFQLVIVRLAFRQAEPPAIIMDHDADIRARLNASGAS